MTTVTRDLANLYCLVVAFASCRAFNIANSLLNYLNIQIVDVVDVTIRKSNF